jgi:hypothetical protein
MYCKFVLIMILGMLADKVDERDIKPRVDEAFDMLAEVIESDTLDAVHCLILMRYRIIVSFK